MPLGLMLWGQVRVFNILFNYLTGALSPYDGNGSTLRCDEAQEQFKKENK
jgi:hypothetical protein